VRELRLLEGTCDEKRKRSAATKRPAPRKPALALLRDPRLKKIYVYSEGTFVLHNAGRDQEARHQDAGLRR
jgi:hypothetical protein